MFGANLFLNYNKAENQNCPKTFGESPYTSIILRKTVQQVLIQTDGQP
jgi:hypothetical protein